MSITLLLNNEYDSLTLKQKAVEQTIDIIDTWMIILYVAIVECHVW